MNTEQIMSLAEAYAVATSMTLAEPSLKRLSDAATAKAALQDAIKALPELSGNSEQLHELDALKAELEDERTRGLQLLADAKEWQQQFVGAQAEVRALKAEVKTLRDALIHIQQVACSESPELSIASAALGETK